jgi:hypothetical protein
LLIYAKARSKPPAAISAGRFARGKIIALHMTALGMLVAAMLLHETGFVSAGLIVLIEAYLLLTRRGTKISWWPLAYIGVAGTLYLIYSAAAKSSPPQATFEVSTGQYLLQGLVYPSALALARVCQPARCDPLPWFVPASVIFSIGLAIFWKLQRTLLIGLLGVLWFLAGILPTWAGRDFVYNEYAPRLLYLAGCGACIAMAAIVGRGVETARFTTKRVIAFGLVALILLQGTLFVLRRQGLYDEAFALLAQENNAMFAPRQGQALFINTVELFTFKDQEFPLGWWGALVSPWHNRIVTDRHLRALNAGWVIEPAQAQQVQDRARLKLEFHGQVLPPEQLQTAILSATQIYRVEASQGDLHLFQIGQIEQQATPPESFIASWPDEIRLLSATIESEAGVPLLNLDWFVGGPIDPEVTVFVHILNEAGQVVAQADGDLVGGYVPIGLWPPHDRVQERRPLRLSDLPPGQYRIVLGLYNRLTQQRLNPAQANVPRQDGALNLSDFKYP